MPVAVLFAVGGILWIILVVILVLLGALFTVKSPGFLSSFNLFVLGRSLAIDIVIADAAGAKSPVAPWEHPLGVANAGSASAPRANYRSAGLADFVAAIDEGRPARCGVDLVLHAVDVMTALLLAGETGEVQTLTTTCERPAALGPDEAKALLR